MFDFVRQTDASAAAIATEANQSRLLQRQLIATALLLTVTTTASAFNDTRQLNPEDRAGNWSLGASYSWQQSVYAGEDYRTDFMPTFTYTGERFFLDTTNLGWHAIDNSQWQLDLFGSYFIQGYNDHSFFSDTGEVRDEDDPLKGMERKNAFEGGIEITRKTNFGRFGLQYAHDIDNVHNGSDARARWTKVLYRGRWELQPWAEYQWWSSEKADYYFGVQDSEVTDTRPAYELGSSGSWAGGLAGRYRLRPEQTVTLNVGYRHHNSDIKESPVVTERGSVSVQLGYRYEFGDMRSTSDGSDFNFFRNNSNPVSVRAAYGCTTRTKFNTILRGEVNCSETTNLASFFASRQLAPTFFGLPIEIWLQGGVAKRFEDGLQDDFFEGVVAFKGIYRAFPWSDHIGTRLGFAEGFSYSESVPWIEKEKAEEQDRRTSHLLNYLEFSLDVSVGDVFGAESLRNLFFGFYVHHRSGIFATSDLYGNVDGGSNVNALYLEWELR